MPGALAGDGAVLQRLAAPVRRVARRHRPHGRINGMPFTIIGVGPDGFHGVNSLFGPDGWVPTMMYGQVLPAQFRGWMDERRALVFSLAGRLKPGADDRSGARQSDAAIAKSLEQTYPQPNEGRSTSLRPLTEATIFPGVREGLMAGHGGADDDRQSGAAHRVLERRESAARARHESPAGDRGAAGARRQPRAAGPPAHDRERAARPVGRRASVWSSRLGREI